MKLPKLFYLLAFYIFFQFAWWTYLLLNQNEEIFLERTLLESRYSKNELNILDQKKRKKRLMVLGEGAVFLTLLGIGTYRISRTFSKELSLNRQQTNFLLAVTHEFKSPLAAVKLNLQTLLKHRLSEEQNTRLLNNSVTDCERIDSLVENALLAARIENKAYSYSFQQVDLNALITDIINLKSWKVKFEISQTESLTVNGDKLALSSLLRNIIDNADKYSPENSLVIIKTLKDKDKAIVSITDRGPGVPAKDRIKIFDKFYRLGNESTRTTKGTGLGLYIAKNIAEAHRGKISCRANSPEGSIFEIQLPT